MFFSRPKQGVGIRQFGHAILQNYGIENVELFPKQNATSTGPGSLIKMPFGRHKLTGKRYGFTNPDGIPLGSSLRDQIDVLTSPLTVSSEEMTVSSSR